MGTGGIIALVVAGVAVAGGAFWWIHSTSKAGTVPAATKPPASSGGWLSTVTGVSGAANQLSGAFVNVTAGISNLQDM